jgi:hypothetical protein
MRDIPVRTGAVLFLLLLPRAFGFVAKFPAQRICRPIMKPVKFQESPDCHSHDIRQTNDSFPLTRKHGKRREKLRALVKRVIPKKHNIVCFIIAVLAYLRGPSIITSDVDHHVAHAGVSVKFSGAKVEATIKDIPPLLIPIKPAAPKKVVKATPVPTPAPAPKPVTKTVVEKERKNVLKPASKFAKKVVMSDLPNLVTSTPGSLVISAGGGIYAAVYSRKNRPEGSKEEARDAQTQEIVKKFLGEE